MTKMGVKALLLQKGDKPRMEAGKTEPEPQPKTMFTLRQKIVFPIVALLYFNSAMIVSMQAPFYPAEAEKKNATATEYSLVLGSYDLVRVVVTPIAASYVARIGIGVAFNIGVLLEATSTFLFGFLSLVDSRAGFIGLSFLLRATEAIGASSSGIAVFSLAGREYPHSVGTVSGLVETIYGFGLSIGPVVGSVLHSIGGFTLPFAAVAVLHYFLTVLVDLFVVRRKTFASVEELKEQKETKSASPPPETKRELQKKYRIVNLLKVPTIVFFCICMFVVAVNIGFRTALLEPHLRQFHLAETWVGTLFLLNSGSYAIFSIIIAFILKRFPTWAIWFILVGGALNAVAFAILGPVPFLPFKSSLGLTISALFIQGVGQAAVFISIFNLAYEEARIHTFTDMDRTIPLVSSLILIACSIGISCGAGTAGVLYDAFGFPKASIFIVTLNTAVTLSTVLFINFREKLRRVPPAESPTEANALLESAGQVYH